MPSKFLQLDPRDNVLAALTDLREGERFELSGRTYTLTTDVPAKHKFSIASLKPGCDVIMYGLVVGKALQPIAIGERLGTNNIASHRLPLDPHHAKYKWRPPDVSRWQGRTFSGFHRSDGQVGTRNHWLVVPLVFCENRNIGALRQAFEEGWVSVSLPYFASRSPDSPRSIAKARRRKCRRAEIVSPPNGHLSGQLSKTSTA